MLAEFEMRSPLVGSNLKVVIFRIHGLWSVAQGYHLSGISGNLGMSGNNVQVREKLVSWSLTSLFRSGKRHKVMKRSGKLCSQGF